jgi:branched-chain amino acid transport system permease protein
VRETVAEALGINIARYKLLAFVISSSMTRSPGVCLPITAGSFSVEAFDLFLSIQYVAMIIHRRHGLAARRIAGRDVRDVFPYLIEALLRLLPMPRNIAGDIFAVNYRVRRA